MLKPDKNFKLPKQVKRFMALGKFQNDQARNDYKNSMIQAYLFEQATRHKTKKEKSEK